MAAGLEFEGVTRRYIGAGASVVALDRVTLRVAPGSFVTVVGPTGCGKTTLLRVAAGLERPDSGAVRVAGQEVLGPRREVGLVFQQYALLPWRSVLDNVAFGLELAGVGRVERRAKAQELIRMVGLAGFERSRPHELSGGMQQRAAIARALATDPAVLLADEPFGALDERTRHRLQDELLAIWQQTGKTVVFVTHNVDEAVYLGDRVVVMADRPGRIIGEVTVRMGRPRPRFGPEFDGVLLQVRDLLEQALSVIVEGNDGTDKTKGGSNEESRSSRSTSCCGR